MAHFHRIGVHSGLIFAAFVAGAAQAMPAAGEELKSFNIPAEDANLAVPAFVQQSGLQILATSADLKGVRTNAVQGTLSVDAALSALISRTTLIVRTRAANLAVLGRAPEADIRPTAPVSATGAAPASVRSAEPPQEVVVVSTLKSLRDALEIKRLHTGIMEAVSSKDIGALPDVSIAEELSRLPGVVTARDRGNDSQVSIRGMGSRMVLGTVNGREVASSEPDRNVRWEVYPSEVVSGASVLKSSEARLISGGISGTVDIQTLRPLDYRGPQWVVRAGPVYYNGGNGFPGYRGLGHRASASFVKRLTPDLGLVIGLTSQVQKNGYESVQGWGYNYGADNGAVLAAEPATKYNTPWGALAAGTGLTESRLGLSAGLQYRPSQAFLLGYDLLYSAIKIDENQNQAWYGNGVWGNWDGGNYQNYVDGAVQSGRPPVIENGDVIAASVTGASDNSVVSRYTENRKLFVTGVNAKWSGGVWTVTADGSYSRAQRYNLWAADEFQYWPALMRYDFRGRPVITVSTPPQPGAQSPNNGQWTSGVVTDTLSALHLDAKRGFAGGFWTGLMFGARSSVRAKTLGVTNGTILPSAGTLSASLLTAYRFRHFAVPAVLTGDFDALSAALYPAGSFDIDARATPVTDRVRENVTEAYVEGTYATRWGMVPVDGNAGVRLLHVGTNSTGSQMVPGDWVEAPPGSGNWAQQTTRTPIRGGVTYTKVLPSVTARLDFGGGRYLKLSAAEVISRPPLNDMVITRQISAVAPYTGGSGNPYLQPFEATQFDLSYEHYSGKDALAAVSLYYKDVRNYVGYAQRQQTIDGHLYSLSLPVNAPRGGYIGGMELTWQTPLAFAGLDHFGVYSNYTYTDSKLKEMAAGLPLNGLAKDTATLDLWYSDHGFDLRLGGKYHSTYTAIYGWDDKQLIRVRPEATLDFSASYAAGRSIQVRFQANNLLNTPLHTYQDNRPDRLGRYDLYGQRILLDITFRR